MNDVLESLLIREIRVDDAGRLGEIQAAITKVPVDFDFKDIIEGQLGRSENASYVAEIEDRVVGYMISYVVYGGYGLQKSAWIATLGVDPKYMGRGVGKRLAQKILDRYKEMGVKNIYTSVLWDSADVLSFFKTLGFSRSDHINLRKELDI
jgi:ribosomal protein S18 acetylase RimI-like enzyme